MLLQSPLSNSFLIINIFQMPSFSCLLLVSLFLYPFSVQPIEFFFDGFAGVDDVHLYDTAGIIKNGIVQLTTTRKLRTAYLLYSIPISFKDHESGGVSSFSTAFTFAMVPEIPGRGGHGIDFTVSAIDNNYWMSALPALYSGLFNHHSMGNASNHIFAVEFDTILNPEFEDINDNHVGIDLNSLISSFFVPAAYFTEDGTKVNVSLLSQDTIQAWIDFDSATSVINVTISPSASKPKIPLMSHKINLSSIFQDSMYVGISCSTGLYPSSHYLMGWSFNTSGPARSLPMTKLPLPPTTKIHMTLAIALSISLCSVLIAALYLIKRMRDADVIEAWEKNIGPHRYPYKELKIATKGFNDKELLGRGGFGRVYKGTLPKTKTLVAVKRVSQESRQGLREFMAEISTIGRVRHRNVAQLVGWCRRRDDLILVYEYMSNGSLDKYLFDQPMMVLTWEQRFNIIKGVASGLLYLHEGWEQVVVHRDVKSSNVLLDSELNGHLGDFGLARLHDHGANLATTRMVGTLGYLAPELSKTGKATTSTDVFAFGTLLLEAVCGRRPIEQRAPQEELVLVEWVWDKWVEGSITSVVDPRLGGMFDEVEVTMVLKLGLMCSCDVPVARPDMRQVVSYLMGEMEVPDELVPPSGVENVEGSKGFFHSYKSSEFDVMSSNTSSKGEVDVDWHASSPAPLLASSH